MKTTIVQLEIRGMRIPGFEIREEHAEIEVVSRKVSEHVYDLIEPEKGSMFGVGVAKTRDNGGNITIFAMRGEEQAVIGTGIFEYWSFRPGPYQNIDRPEVKDA